MTMVVAIKNAQSPPGSAKKTKHHSDTNNKVITPASASRATTRAQEKYQKPLTQRFGTLTKSSENLGKTGTRQKRSLVDDNDVDHDEKADDDGQEAEEGRCSDAERREYNNNYSASESSGDEKTSNDKTVSRKIELHSYIGKSCLTQGEKSVLITYFRKTFFKNLKFTHDTILQMNSKECMTIFQIINIDNNEAKKNEKHKDIIKLLESCLTSKRNYVVERVRQKIKGKSKKI